MRGTVLVSILALAVGLVSAPSWGANRKAWVRLTECQYVEHAYNDGDSFHVQCGEQVFVVRLYFVDAPESTLRYPDRTREQSEYFGVTLDETLRAGRQATHLVRERLQAPFVVWTRRARAGGSTTMLRYYGFVEVEGHSLAELLVSEGLARTKGVIATGPTGVPAHVVQERLQALERTAREHKRGIWATSAPGPTAQATHEMGPGSSERGPADPAYQTPAARDNDPLLPSTYGFRDSGDRRQQIP